MTELLTWVARFLQPVMLSWTGSPDRNCIRAINFAGAAVKEAFITMLDLSAVLNLVPYVYIFAAILMLTSNKNAAMRSRGRFSNYTLRTFGSVGLLTTLLAIFVVFVPSKQVGSVPLFELKMFSGSLFFLGLGAFFFYNGWRKLRG